MQYMCTCKSCVTITAKDGQLHRHFYNHPTEQELIEHKRICDFYDI